MTTLSAILPKLAVFLVAALVGVFVANIVAAAVHQEPLESQATREPDFVLAGPGPSPGNAPPVAFELVKQGDQQAVEELPAAELASTTAAVLDSGPPNWLNPSGFPRIRPITQFDGGEFQGSNCTLASGAMLAKMAFNVTTNGSVLRKLQNDQSGGTGLDDLQVALWKGYGKTIKSGGITPAQLKKLLAAGYGAVVQGDYGEIPREIRLSDFAGPHAIYLDGFFAGDGKIPPAYYVIDPIGRPQYGYEGEWWPASVVDQFALGLSSSSVGRQVASIGPGLPALPSGRMSAAWAFPPGGQAPDVVGPDVVPLPSSGGDEPAPPTAAPGSGAPPSGSSAPPSSVPPVSAEPEPGDEDPGPSGGGGHTYPFDPGLLGGITLLPWLEVCLPDPPPPGCPGGIEGIVTLVAVAAPILAPPPAIEITFVDSDRPNVALVGFRIEPSAPADVRFWEADGDPATVMTASSMASHVTLGEPTIVATLDVHAATEYYFQVVAGDGASAVASPIATFTTGSGVRDFGVVIDSLADATLQTVVGLSPYPHAAEGAFVPGLFQAAADICTGRVLFGEETYCTGPRSAAPDECRTAVVDYDLVGVEASGVLVRAFPDETGHRPNGTISYRGVVEMDGPAGTGSVEIGCLTPGLTYNLVVDAVGDEAGPLVYQTVEVPEQ